MNWRGRSGGKETMWDAVETVRARGDEGLAANSSNEQIFVK